MEIILRVDDSFRKKIQSLQDLTGLSNSQIESHLGSLFEQAFSNKVMSVFGTPAIHSTKMTHPRKKISSISMEEGASELGDEDPSFQDNPEESQEVEGLTEPEAFVPDSGGLTDDVLDHDMDLENPEIEAKGSAPNLLSSGLKPVEETATQEFAQTMFGDDDSWAAKRRKNIKLKGKVSLGVNQSEEVL